MVSVKTGALSITKSASKAFSEKLPLKNLHAVAIFFNIEKAYDTNWKHGILQDRQDLHLQGHLPNFIK